MNIRRGRTGLLCVFGLCITTATAVGQHTNITGFADQNGGQHLFYVDSNSHLNQLYYLAGTTWQTQDLTGMYGGNKPEADSPLTSYADIYGGQHVYYIDSNAHLNQIFYVNGATTWQTQDMTALYGGATATSTSLAGFYDNYNGEEHVFYTDADGHIDQYFYSGTGTTWLQQDLTALYGGNTAAGGSPLTAFVDFSLGQHVAYLDSNNHLNQLFYVGGSMWIPQDLTATQGGNMPASTSNLAAYIDPSTGGQHIVYEDGSQHLNQLIYLPGASAWTAQDLTATQGGNMPEIGSHLTSYIDGSTLQHIAYLDSSQHVNQMFYPGSGPSWITQDLTALYGGNTAGPGSGLVGYPAFLDPGAIGQHLAYLDGSDNVNQIYYLATGGSSWLTQNLTSQYGGNAPALLPVSTVGSNTAGSSEWFTQDQ